MAHSPQPLYPITFVISEIVNPDRIQEYEAWTRGITQASSQSEGFLGAEIIRPRDHEHPEYVIIVRFDTYSHLKQWTTSRTYYEWLDKAQGFIAQRSVQELPSGMEIWFTLPQNGISQIKQPAYYKQVIIGVLAVYPLILLSNAVLGPFLTGLPFPVALLISVFFVSALLTYPVMPWLTHILNFWLYPPVRRRQ